MFSGFGMLSSIKIHFSQVKIISIEIGCEVYSRFKVMNGFFGIAYKKKKAGHFNKTPKNDVGWHIQRWDQFLLPVALRF